jgi:hypothetical protein
MCQIGGVMMTLAVDPLPDRAFVNTVGAGHVSHRVANQYAVVFIVVDSRGMYARLDFVAVGLTSRWMVRAS